MYRLLMVGILGLSVMSLTACESMTGKTAGRTIDDATTTASVQGKLTGDKMSNFTRIDVNTTRGVVTLTGVVQTPGEKSRAENLAQEVNGVTKVNNNLQIQSLSSSNQ
ncbi:MAG: BON domain-containing protein [Nitrospirota bacterium]